MYLFNDLESLLIVIQVGYVAGVQNHVHIFQETLVLNKAANKQYKSCMDVQLKQM